MRLASYVPGELILCAFVWLDPGITPCCRNRHTDAPREGWSIFLKRSIATRWMVRALTLDFTDACNAYAAHKEAIGGGRAINLASLRRFCAIAANVNSNWAPHGPRNRNRPSRRMRFK